MTWVYSNEPLERSWKNAALCILAHTLTLAVMALLLSLLLRRFLPSFDTAFYLLLMLTLGPMNDYVVYRMRTNRFLSGS